MREFKQGDLVKFRPSGSRKVCVGIVMARTLNKYGSRHTSSTRTIAELTVLSQGQIVKVYEPRVDLLKKEI